MISKWVKKAQEKKMRKQENMSVVAAVRAHIEQLQVNLTYCRASEEKWSQK